VLKKSAKKLLKIFEKIPFKGIQLRIRKLSTKKTVKLESFKEVDECYKIEVSN
jgi:hypothetical protein